MISSQILKYVDNILYHACKKISYVGIYNDVTSRTVFFAQPNMLDFLNNLVIIFEPLFNTNFCIQLDYEIFRKIVDLNCDVEMNVDKNYINVNYRFSNHRSKVIETDYHDFDYATGDKYHIFTVDLALPLTHCFIPKFDVHEYRSLKEFGGFETSVNLIFQGNKIISTTSDRVILTRYTHKTSTNFIGHNISIPIEAVNFTLLTLRELNSLDITITDSSICLSIDDPKYKSIIKYSVKFHVAKFPQIDSILAPKPVHFSVPIDSLNEFLNNFIAVKNPANGKEIVKLSLADSLNMSLIHNDHQSEANLDVTIHQPTEDVSFFDLDVIKKIVKVAPKCVVNIHLGTTHIQMFSQDNNFQSAFMGIDPNYVYEIRNNQ